MNENPKESKEVLAAQEDALSQTLTAGFAELARLANIVLPVPDINGEAKSVSVKPPAGSGPTIQNIGIVTASCLLKKPTEQFDFISPGDSPGELAKRLIALQDTDLVPKKTTDTAYGTSITLGPIEIAVPVGDKAPYRSFKTMLTVTIDEDCVM